MATQAKSTVKKEKNSLPLIENTKKYKIFYPIIFVFAFLLYANTFHHEWVLDDYGSFKLNIYVTAGANGYHDILTKSYRHGSGFYTDQLYRPLSQLMFATEWHMFPDSPGLYHAISVIFFTLACVVLLAFLRRLLKAYSPWIPFLIALLFAAHPIHTEVVANIKSRDEIMCCLFVFLTLWFSLLYVDRRKVFYLPLMFVSFLLAMFSKESAITILAVLPLTLFFFRKANAKEYVLTLLMLVVPAAVYLMVRHSVLAPYREMSDFSVSLVDNYFYDTDLWTGWATAIMLLGQYLVKLIFPYSLACDYSLKQFPITTFTDFSTWCSLLIHLALLIYAIFGIRQKKPMAYSIFFYIITMSIYSNLVYRIGSSFAERFLFMPSLAFCVAIVFLVFQIFKIDKKEENQIQGIRQNNDKKMKNNKLAVPVAIFVVVLSLFSWRTVTRAAEWKDQFTLFGADVKKSDNSAHMRLYWGLALRDKGYDCLDANKKETNWAKYQENEKQYKEWMWKAIEQFKKGVEIFPEYADCYEQLGVLYDQYGVKINNMTYRDTAEYYFLKSLQYVPSKATCNSNLAKIYFERGDMMKAKHYYKEAVLYDPLLADGYFNLGSTYGTLAMYDSSFYYYHKCLEIDPKRVDAITFLGLNYFNIGKPDSAIYYYDKAIAMDPYSSSGYVLKSKVLLLTERWNEGEKVLDKALSLFPYNGEIYFYKGLVEKNRRDYAKALQMMNSCIQYQSNFLEAYREKGLLFKELGSPDSSAYYLNFVRQIDEALAAQAAAQAAGK